MYCTVLYCTVQLYRYQHMLRNKLVTPLQLATQPAFPEFVDWLIAERWSGPGTRPTHHHDAMSRSGQDGSRKSWRAEKTWVPYHAVCPVCQNNFTVLKLDAEK